MNPLQRIFGIFLAIVFAVQSYDAFRSAVTGTQPKESAPDKDPRSISARAGGVAWGLISAGISLLGLLVSIFG
jgi:hypothetical protein